jgi:hypothetical protein
LLFFHRILLATQSGRRLPQSKTSRNDSDGWQTAAIALLKPL